MDRLPRVGARVRARAAGLSLIPSREYRAYQAAFDAWAAALEESVDDKDPGFVVAVLDMNARRIAGSVLARRVRSWRDVAEVGLVAYSLLCQGSGETFEMVSSAPDLEEAVMKAVATMAHASLGAWPKHLVEFKGASNVA